MASGTSRFKYFAVIFSCFQSENTFGRLQSTSGSNTPSFRGRHRAIRAASFGFAGDFSGEGEMGRPNELVMSLVRRMDLTKAAGPSEISHACPDDESSKTLRARAFPMPGQ